MKKLTRALNSIGEDSLRVSRKFLNLLPAEDASYDLGSSNLRWVSAHLSEYLRVYSDNEQVRITPSGKDDINWEYAGSMPLRVYNEDTATELFAIEIDGDILSHGSIDMNDHKITNLTQATNVNEAVAGGRFLNAGTALSGGGDLTSDVSFRVTQNGVTTREIDETISPTWTGTHTFQSDINLSNTDLIEPNQIKTGGGGSDTITVRDVANNQDLMTFREGNPIQINAVDLSLEANDIKNTGHIIPSTSDTYDLGTSRKKYRQVYAHTVVGDLTGDEWTFNGAMLIDTQGNNLSINADSVSANAVLDMNGNLLDEVSNVSSSGDLTIDREGIDKLIVGTDEVDVLNANLDANKNDVLNTGSITAGSPGTYSIGEAGTKFSSIYAGSIVANLRGETWTYGGNMTIDADNYNLSITAGSVVSGGMVDMSGNRIDNLAQATAASEAVTGGRVLIGGNAIDAIGDLTQDRTIAVSTDGIEEDEINLAITPEWTGNHTFSANVYAGTDRTYDIGTAGSAFANMYAGSVHATLNTSEWVYGGNISIDVGTNNINITASSIVSGGALDDVTRVSSSGDLDIDRQGTNKIVVGAGTIDMLNADVSMNENNIRNTANILPGTPSTYDLGTTDNKWSRVYADTILGNITGDEWTYSGSMTIDTQGNELTISATTTSVGGKMDMGSHKITNLDQGTDVSDAVAAGRTLTAGSGLSGGGDLTQDRTISVGAGSITNSMITNPSITVSAGNALSGGGQISLGASKTLRVGSGSIQTNELDLTIVPTWEGEHQFNAGIDVRADIADSATTIWDHSAGYIPQGRLQNDSLTLNTGEGIVGGGVISLGGSRSIKVGAGSVTNDLIANSSITLTGGNAIDAIGEIQLGGSASVDVSLDGIKTDELDLSITPRWAGSHTWRKQGTANADTTGYNSYSIRTEESVWDSARTVEATPINRMRGYANDDTDYGILLESQDVGGVYVTVLTFNRDSSVLTIPSGNVKITGGYLDMGGYKVQNVLQATAGSDVVTGRRTISTGEGLSGGGRLTNDKTLSIGAGSVTNNLIANSAITLTGGNAIDAIGQIELGQASTIAVSSNAIQTDEIDLSISPTWTGDHTFSANILAGTNATYDIGSAGTEFANVYATSVLASIYGNSWSFSGDISINTQGYNLKITASTVSSSAHIDVGGNSLLDVSNIGGGGNAVVFDDVVDMAANSIVATGDVVPSTAKTYDIGNSGNEYRNIYAGSVTADLHGQRWEYTSGVTIDVGTNDVNITANTVSSGALLNMNGNYILQPGQIRTGGQSVTIRDSTNNVNVSIFKEGGDIEVPSGQFLMNKQGTADSATTGYDSYNVQLRSSVWSTAHTVEVTPTNQLRGYGVSDTDYGLLLEAQDTGGNYTNVFTFNRSSNLLEVPSGALKVSGGGLDLTGGNLDMNNNVIEDSADSVVTVRSGNDLKVTDDNSTVFGTGRDYNIKYNSTKNRLEFVHAGTLLAFFG